MISESLIPLTFFTPFIITNYLFTHAYLHYAQLYRKIKNPNYPILLKERNKFLQDDPVKYILHMPLYAFLMWKIVFESNKDQLLNKAARKTRNFFFLFLLVIILDFLFHILALKYGLFS